MINYNAKAFWRMDITNLITSVATIVNLAILIYVSIPVGSDKIIVNEGDTVDLRVSDEHLTLHQMFNIMNRGNKTGFITKEEVYLVSKSRDNTDNPKYCKHFSKVYYSDNNQSYIPFLVWTVYPNESMDSKFGFYPKEQNDDNISAFESGKYEYIILFTKNYEDKPFYEKRYEITIEKSQLINLVDNKQITVSLNTGVNPVLPDEMTVYKTIASSNNGYQWNGEATTVINGIRWATCNVNAPGTFAASPSETGMLYQWNRKTGWSGEDPLVNSEGSVIWDYNIPEGTVWEKANDPSPAGYRVPTLDEIKKLFDNNKVSNIWITLNGVEGRKFNDRKNGNSIFFPAAGYRNLKDGTLYDTGKNGFYWSSTQYNSSRAYNLGCYSEKTERVDNEFGFGHSIRSVVE